jgi:hypothetical protein
LAGDYIGDALKPPDSDETQGCGPSLDSHFRTHNDWHEDPWAAPAVKARRRRERHARWIASISDRDWKRLAARADVVLAGARLARFDDLDAPIAVYVAHPGDTHLPNGERFGELRGCPLLAFRKAP